MKKQIVLILLIVLAVSVSATHTSFYNGKKYTPTRFNPTGAMSILERGVIIVAPSAIVIRPGIARTARVVFPRVGKFVWSTDSDTFKVMQGYGGDGRIVEVQGLKVGQGQLTVTTDKEQTATITVFVRRR